MRAFVLFCMIVAAAQGTPFYGDSHESFPDSHEDHSWEDNSGSFESLALAATSGWEKAAFDHINNLRAQAHLEPLNYNRSIAAGSQQWAKTIACNAKHTPKPWDGFTSENLAGLYMSMSEEERAKNGVQRWFDEVKDYKCTPLIQGKYSGTPYYNKVGHFVNMMRSDIQEVGLGMAKCPSDPNKGQIVARFYGDFEKNLPVYRAQLGIGEYDGCCAGLDVSAFVPCPQRK